MKLVIRPEKRELHTVADAENIARIAGPAYLEELAAIDDTLAKHDARGCLPGIPNDIHMFTLGWTRRLIRKTFSDFRMLTGSDYLAHMLRDDFREMLSRLLQSNGKARVILLDGRSEGFDALEEEFPDTLHLVLTTQINPERPVSHFLVSDGVRAREEEPHAPLMPTTPMDGIHASTYFRNSVKGSLLQTRFRVMWEGVTEEVIDPKKVKKRKWWHFGT